MMCTSLCWLYCVVSERKGPWSRITIFSNVQSSPVHNIHRRDTTSDVKWNCRPRWSVKFSSIPTTKLTLSTTTSMTTHHATKDAYSFRIQSAGGTDNSLRANAKSRNRKLESRTEQRFLSNAYSKLSNPTISDCVYVCVQLLRVL